MRTILSAFEAPVCPAAAHISRKADSKLSHWSGVLALISLSGVIACTDENPTNSSPTASASDSGSTVSSHSVTSERASGNSKPGIRSLRLVPESPTPDDKVRVIVDAFDPDGDPLELYFRWTLAGESVGSETREVSLSGASKGERLVSSVVASDGLVESEWASTEVRIANRAPRLQRVSIQPSSEIVAGMEVVATPEASDADGDALEFIYQWRLNERPVGESSSNFSTAGLKRGDTISLSVRAFDGEDESASLDSPELRIVNAPPRIVSKPGKPSADGVFRYRVAAEDPDGDAGLEFALVVSPAGMEIDRWSGDITWEPESAQLGTRRVSVMVDDLQGGQSTQNFEVTVHETTD